MIFKRKLSIKVLAFNHWLKIYLLIVIIKLKETLALLRNQDFFILTPIFELVSRIYDVHSCNVSNLSFKLFQAHKGALPQFFSNLDSHFNFVQCIGNAFLIINKYLVSVMELKAIYRDHNSLLCIQMLSPVFVYIDSIYL